MRGCFAALILGVTLMLPAAALAERVIARISITDQTMRVYHEGRLLFTWPVSTARAGKVTPTGYFHPELLARNHRSKRYNNAPMPFSIFYDGDFAIHGTDQIGRLGKPASHGCVRLHPDNAKILFEMVKWEGLENTLVEVIQ